MKPVFLVKGVEGLESGPVTTAFYYPGEFTGLILHLNSPVNLKLHGMQYQLRVASKKTPDPVKDPLLPDDARLVLTAGNSTQVLYSPGHAVDDAEWELIWAGDLDRDGKLDLYVDVTWHYNISQHTLFLSSQAGKGQLVRKVAVFETSGC